MAYNYILVSLSHSERSHLVEGNLAHASVLHVIGKLLHHSEDTKAIHDLPSCRKRFMWLG